MPIHGWTRVDDGVFHDFHGSWITAIRTALNTGLLPDEFYALAEQSVGDIGPDVLASERRLVIRNESQYRMVAVMEIVSPGNKSSQRELRQFVQKSVEILRQGVHLLIIDLLPPTIIDPQGIHGAIWRELAKDNYQMPAEKRLTLAAYAVAEQAVAYVEPRAVGDALAEMPLFLTSEYYVYVPLEKTYLEAWRGVPKHLRQILEGHG